MQKKTSLWLWTLLSLSIGIVTGWITFIMMIALQAIHK
jgi:hypothetical protein